METLSASCKRTPAGSTTIAICDDDELHSNKLTQMLVAYSRKTGYAFRILNFCDGKNLLMCSEPFHILFMDAHTPAMDSMETAWRMRRANPDFLLIFVSAHMKYAPMGYEVQAFRYLLKPQLDASLGRCMDAALETLGVSRTALRLPFVGGSRKIFADEILFVESRKHAVYFHMAGSQRELHLYEKLDNIAKLLPGNDFIRIHKSYLVGRRYLNGVLNYAAFLSTGQVLPVSQKKFGDVKRELICCKWQ